MKAGKIICACLFKRPHRFLKPGKSGWGAQQGWLTCLCDGFESVRIPGHGACTDYRILLSEAKDAGGVASDAGDCIQAVMINLITMAFYSSGIENMTE